MAQKRSLSDPQYKTWFDTFVRWPKERSLPTDEQFEQALERMHKINKENYGNGYQGDWGFTLEFTMATYNRACWWMLFFPDEKITLDEGLPG